MVINTVFTGMGAGLRGETSDESPSKKGKMIELCPEAIARHLSPNFS